jgi:hypothetical protein
MKWLSEENNVNFLFILINCYLSGDCIKLNKSEKVIRILNEIHFSIILRLEKFLYDCVMREDQEVKDKG